MRKKKKENSNMPTLIHWSERPPYSYNDSGDLTTSPSPFDMMIRSSDCFNSSAWVASHLETCSILVEIGLNTVFPTFWRSLKGYLDMSLPLTQSTSKTMTEMIVSSKTCDSYYAHKLDVY